jgi:hypothetical protein
MNVDMEKGIFDISKNDPILKWAGFRASQMLILYANSS